MPTKTRSYDVVVSGPNGQLQLRATIPPVHRFDPMKDSVADIAAALGGEVVTIEGTTDPDLLDPLAFVALLRPERCTAVRDLFEGTPQAGTVIQFCEKDHHMEVHAHRMTTPDGSITTWRR